MSPTENSAAVLDGKEVSGKLFEDLRARIQQHDLRPHLHVITVGEDVGSQVFLKQKRLAAEKVGILFSHSKLPLETSLQQLRQRIYECNRDDSIHGIIIELPLPESFRAHEREVLNLVDPTKDIDCFHPENFGQLALGEPRFVPATPAGIVRLIKHYGIETRGKLCVILGKSNIVGKPLALLLSHEAGPAATVVFCDRHTEGVWDLTRQADILVVAAGKHHLVSDPSVLRADGSTVVIDVGIHRVATAAGKTAVQGDVDADALRHACRWLTPVPGGVGPMTVACLLEQVVEAAMLRKSAITAASTVKRLLVDSIGDKATPLVLEHIFGELKSDLSASEFVNSAVEALGTDANGCLNLEKFVDWAFRQREPSQSQ